jgi:hypothetical protein
VEGSVAKGEGWVAKGEVSVAKGEGWVAKQKDGWLSWQCGFGSSHISKLIIGRHKQRSGQHTTIYY